ncbi:MAG: PAS domain-containing protein [Candidatus Thorarchaeota archaeon]
MLDMNSKIPERIREELRTNPKGLTITDIATRIQVNRNSTARYLDVLQISGHVEMRKVGPAKLYFLSQRVPLEAMLNLSEDGILTFDSDLKVIRVNDAFSRIVCIESDELLGATLDQLELPGLEKERITPLLIESLAGKQIDFETTLQNQGKAKHLDVKLVPTTFDDGSSGSTILLEDSTRRKQSEKEIQRQHAFLNLVMESVAHPFYVINVKDFTIQMANKAARLGLLTHDSTCYELTHRSNKPCSGDIHPCPLKQVVETKRPAIVEHVHHQVSGKTRHVEIHAHPIFDHSQNVVQVIEYNLDVTDRKQVEADLSALLDMFQLIVDNIEDGVFVVQADRIVYCNASLSNALGYEVHEITGVDLSQLIKSGDWDPIKKVVSESNRDGKLSRIHELSMITKKSNTISIRARITLSNYAGAPAWIFNVLKKI